MYICDDIVSVVEAKRPVSVSFVSLETAIAFIDRCIRRCNEPLTKSTTLEMAQKNGKCTYYLPMRLSLLAHTCAYDMTVKE